MSTKANRKKTEQLGMSIGTASNRLRKEVMFNLLRRLNGNICYRCKREIKTAEEMSLEHKIPWLDSHDPIGLFFDLTNIAFSHSACNRRRPGQPTLRKEGPLGTAWCSGCQEFKPTTEFWRNATKYNGYVGYCKDCFRTRGYG